MHEPMPTVDYVDLDRFMGDWYVQGHIPAFVEKDAYDEVETYERREDGAIQTTLTFRKGGFDGPEKTYRPVGFVHDETTNAEWRMRFVWPFTSEYLIIYLDEAYESTIIGRTKRDYAWIMTRSPAIDDERYAELVAFLGERGYDTARVRRVPQSGAAR
jgi:apolipoprotein D and lipocalin family protein